MPRFSAAGGQRGDRCSRAARCRRWLTRSQASAGSGPSGQSGERGLWGVGARRRVRGCPPPVSQYHRGRAHVCHSQCKPVPMHRRHGQTLAHSEQCNNGWDQYSYWFLERQSRAKELPRARPPRKVKPRITPSSELDGPAWRRIYRWAWELTVASPPIQVRGSSVEVSVELLADFIRPSLHRARYIRRSIVLIRAVPAAVLRETSRRKSDPTPIGPGLARSRSECHPPA